MFTGIVVWFDMDDVLALVLSFGELNEIEYMRGNYFIKIFKVEERLRVLVRFVSSRM